MGDEATPIKIFLVHNMNDQLASTEAGLRMEQLEVS
jgi:hypothetical protein